MAISLIFLFLPAAFAQQGRPPSGGRVAVVVDERLAALRETPELSGKLLRRISRGRLVAIRGERHVRGGLVFYRVNLTSRTSGWMQREAVVSSWQKGDDERLWRLIQVSEGFDRINRARIFLDIFPRSALRAAVLLLYGEAAEATGERLSREAVRRLDVKEMNSAGAPLWSYFLNYSGLDRYNRLGLRFTFDEPSRSFHYNGDAWRELIRRYPRSLEAEEARQRLSRKPTSPRSGR
jgi:hypothetical protein